MSGPDRPATWLPLTFSRLHYGGCALAQLLRNTKDMDLSLGRRLWLATALNPSPPVHLSCLNRPRCFSVPSQVRLYFYPRGSIFQERRRADRSSSSSADMELSVCKHIVAHTNAFPSNGDLNESPV